jgi:hypothetical protein
MHRREGLTPTQRAALRALEQTGRQWPLSRRHGSGDNHTEHCRYSQRTLQALVDAGVAQWAPHRHGVMPHIILPPVLAPADAPETEEV